MTNDCEDELSESEIASLFKEKIKKKRKSKQKNIEDMSKEEFEEWEKAQDNANDIYKIASRVKNLARDTDASLTPAGEALCNTYTHVLKELYDFAETVKNKKVKHKLIEIIRKNEIMPGNLIAAMKNGVK